MIEITVKTLDSQNHHFSVEDDITVEQFKAHIADKVNISAETQRIIYCGRVLQDSSKLADYDVNGKVVHLVQSAPPGSSNRSNRAPSPPPESETRRTGFRGFPSRNTMYVGSMAFPSNLMESQGIVPPPPSHSLSGSRLNVAKRMILRAMATIRYLERMDQRLEQEPEEPQEEEEVTPVISASIIVPGEINEQIDEQEFFNEMQNSILRATQGAFSGDQNASGSSGNQENSAGATSSTTRRSGSPENSSSNSNNENSGANAGESSENSFPENAVRSREMANLLSALSHLQTRFEPFLERYRNFMRDDPVVPPENIYQTQTMLNRVSEVFHYLGHAYHSLSDIIIRASSPTPRALLCRPILIQHSAVLQTGIPIQVEAQINFSADRPQNAANSSGTNSANNSSSAENNSNANNSSGTWENVNVGEPSVNIQHSMQPGIIGVPLLQPGAVRVMGPVEIRTVRNGSRRTQNNNNTTENQSSTSQNAENTPTTTQNSNENTNNQNIGGSFILPGNPNVEFLVEVTPEGVTYTPDAASMLGREIFRGAVNTPPPEVLHLMHIVNNQLMNRAGQQSQQSQQTTSANSVSSSSEAAAQSASGQNSQARGNTATNPTTSTNTRSTPRPHVHMTQQAMQVGFDPFLPCNSHHNARRRSTNTTTPQNASQSQNATQQSANNANNTAPSAPPPPDFRNLLNFLPNVMFGRVPQRSEGGAPQAASGEGNQSGGDGGQNELPSFASIFPTLMRGNISDIFRIEGTTTIHQLLQHFHQEDNYGEADSLITDLVLLLSQNLTLVDTVSLSTGNIDPLNRIAGEISNFVRTRVCENDTSARGIENGIERIIVELRPLIHIFEHLPVRNDIDMPRTIERLFRLRLPIILSTALNLSATNVRELMDQLLTTIQHIFALSLNSSANGMAGVEQVLEEFMNRSMSDIPREIRQWTLITSRTQLRRRVSQIQVPNSTLEQYIVKKSTPNVSQDNLNDNTGSLNLTAEVESMEVEESVPASSSVPILESIPMEDTEPLPTVVLGSDSWQVPEDWVPIITRDAQKQRRQNTQPPLSDAYLSGMPSKRRKLINGAKPQGTLPQVISESVRQAVTATGLSTIAPLETVATAAGQSQDIQNAYRNLLRTSVQGNLRENEDFTAERFPNASRYFDCQNRK